MIGDWTASRPQAHLRLPAQGLLARGSRLRRFDWVLTAAVLSLSALGVLLVAAATRPLDPRHPYATAEHQVLFLAIGLMLAVAASLADYRSIRALAPVIYGLALLGLAATFVIGTDVHGAKAWIRIGGGLEIQPSEFTKLAMIVLVGMLFNVRRDDRYEVRDIDVVRALVLMAIPMGIVLLQNDLGTCLVMLAIMFGMVAVGGAPTRWVAGLAVGFAGVAVFAVKLHILHSYQVGRLTSFLHPDSAACLQKDCYNAHQAVLAIGSGGFSGTGLFRGPQINGGHVPAASTDFIFATAGEELGFVGATLIVVLVTIVLWRGLRIATHAPDMFGRIVATGVVCWLAFESFENIGMNIGIMPVTGIPLQFVSYGGSSLFASMLAIGLLQNVHMQTQAAQNSGGGL